MTFHETFHRLLLPIIGTRSATVHADLRRLPGTRILDVGARRSPYTIGLKARITLLDIPRTTETQERLQLGWTSGIQEQIKRKRSNVDRLVLEDMTKCTLPDSTFDGVVSVETIEHVDDPEAFIRQIARVLKPGGWVYLTTPNGDYVPNTNPDHRRHFRRDELLSLLERYFHDVSVRYAIRTGPHHSRAVRALRWQQPIRALVTVKSRILNRLESRDVADRSTGTAHLIALAWKG